MLLISLWKWVYTRFISDLQVITDLYFEEVDEINNALQCSGCYSVIPPEYAICPGCKAQGTIEMVYYPDIEEDGGDIAFDLAPEQHRDNAAFDLSNVIPDLEPIPIAESVGA